MRTRVYIFNAQRLGTRSRACLSPAVAASPQHLHCTSDGWNIFSLSPAKDDRAGRARFTCPLILKNAWEKTCTYTLELNACDVLLLCNLDNSAFIKSDRPNRSVDSKNWKSSLKLTSGIAGSKRFDVNKCNYANSLELGGRGRGRGGGVGGGDRKYFLLVSRISMRAVRVK